MVRLLEFVPTSIHLTVGVFFPPLLFFNVERLKGIDKDFGTQQYKFAAEPKKGVVSKLQN